MTDVVIVGGGPVGCYTANCLAKRSIGSTIIEEHRDIGWPIQCAGLLSTRVFKILDFPGIRKSIQNEVRGVKVFSPSGRTVEIKADDTKAYVVDRNIFDKEIAIQALRNGAKMSLGTRALGSVRKDGGVVTRVQGRDGVNEINSKLIIGADGAQSSVASWYGLPKPKLLFSSFEAEVANLQIPDDMVYFFLSQEISPGFFSWIIPTGSNVARVGLGMSSKDAVPRQQLEKLMDSKIFLKAIDWNKKKPPQPLKLIAGSIPMGMVERMFDDNVMLVGDTAGLPKPVSGGGIYTGCVSAEHAAETAEYALKKGKYEKKYLKGYQKGVKKKLNNELKNTLALRKIYMEMTDENLETAFDVLEDPEVIDYISKHGDIDYPFKLGKKVLAKMPRLFKFVGPFLKGTVFAK